MLTRSLERPSTGSHPIEVLIPEVRQETRRRRALQIAFTALVLVVAGSVGFLAIENPSARLPTRVLPPSRNPAPLRTVVLPAVTKVASSTCGANNRQGWFSEVHVIAAYELSASVLRSKSGFYGNSYLERLGPRTPFIACYVSGKDAALLIPSLRGGPQPKVTLTLATYMLYRSGSLMGSIGGKARFPIEAGEHG